MFDWKDHQMMKFKGWTGSGQEMIGKVGMSNLNVALVTSPNKQYLCNNKNTHKVKIAHLP